MEKIGEKKYLNPAWEITVRLNNEEIDTILAIPIPQSDVF